MKLSYSTNKGGTRLYVYLTPDELQQWTGHSHSIGNQRVSCRLDGPRRIVAAIDATGSVVLTKTEPGKRSIYSAHFSQAARLLSITGPRLFAKEVPAQFQGSRLIVDIPEELASVQQPAPTIIKATDEPAAAIKTLNAWLKDNSDAEVVIENHQVVVRILRELR